MSLATRCPSCSTVFRVVADQLKLRGGLVRCGRCNQVFKGTDHLLDTEGGQSRFLPALSVPTSMVAPPVFVTPHQPQPTEAALTEQHEISPATNLTIDALPSTANSDADSDHHESTDQALADEASAPDVAPLVDLPLTDLAALSVNPEDITLSESETDTPEIVAEFDAGFIDSALPSTDEPSVEPSISETVAVDAAINNNPHAESPPSLFLDEAPRLPTENESRPMLTEPEVHFDLAEPLFDLEPEEESTVAEAAAPIEPEAIEDLSAFVEPVFEAEPILQTNSATAPKEDDPFDLLLNDDELAEWSPPDNVLQEVSQPEPIASHFAYPQELALPVIHHDEPASNQHGIDTQSQGTSNTSSGDDFPSFAAVLKHPASEDKSGSDNGRTEPFISSQFAVSEHTPPSSDVFVALNDEDASQKLREQLTQSAQEDYQAMAEPSFLAAPHQRGKWLSVLLGLGAFIASALLLFQAIYIWRDQIAATIPELEIPLVQFCQYAGCQLDFPKRIEQLAVESSDLAPVPNQPHHYVLSGLIRSRAEGTLALPVLELTLLDLQGQPVLRKVLTPTQYLPEMNSEIEHGTIRIMQNQRMPNQTDNRHFGIAGSSEIKLNTVFETNVENAVGYRAYIFYP